MMRRVGRGGEGELGVEETDRQRSKHTGRRREGPTQRERRGAVRDEDVLGGSSQTGTGGRGAGRREAGRD